VARGDVPGTECAQQRLLLRAEILGARAARAEAATGRRVARARQLAADRDLTDAVSGRRRVGDRDRPDQAIGVGVRRAQVDVVARAELDDPSERFCIA